jgi:hypothetical protein
MNMIAKAFAMYMGGSKDKRTARPSAPHAPGTRLVRKAK